jgi:hypothetical protein
MCLTEVRLAVQVPALLPGAAVAGSAGVAAARGPSRGGARPGVLQAGRYRMKRRRR